MVRHNREIIVHRVYEQRSLECEKCKRQVTKYIDTSRIFPGFWFCDECLYGQPVQMDDWEGNGSW